MPQQFVVAEGAIRIDYVVITTQTDGKAIAIERYEEIEEGSVR
jgi:hypothetical protein